jgi:hypothetical protein
MTVVVVRHSSRSALVSFALALVELSACSPPSPFKSTDEARGTVLAANVVLRLGPVCSQSLPHIQFDLDRARDDEAQAATYMRSHGVTDAQIGSLRDAVRGETIPPNLSDTNLPALNDVCLMTWQNALRYRLHAEAGAPLAPPVTQAQFDKRQAEMEAEDKQTAAFDNQLRLLQQKLQALSVAATSPVQTTGRR